MHSDDTKYLMRLAKLKHGHAGSCDQKKNKRSPEYSAWMGIKQRCSDVARGRFRKNYYERGIRVCARWADFPTFLADMGRKPTPDHQLDRIDNNGNYEPSNCRWATRLEQQNNRRNTVWVWFDGEVVPASFVSRTLGIRHSRIREMTEVAV